MCFFRRKKKDNKNELRDEDIKIIKANALNIEVLIETVGTNVALKERLIKLKNKVEFLNPVGNPEVLNMDRKIGNQIGNMRSVLEYAAEEDGVFDEAAEAIRELEVTIAERNTKI